MCPPPKKINTKDAPKKGKYKILYSRGSFRTVN